MAVGWTVYQDVMKQTITHPTSMISKHSTILVPDNLYASRKISFTFHFLT